MKTRHKRLIIILAGVAVLSVALTLIFKAFNSNMVFFFSPSDVQAKQAPVENGSLQREDDGLTVHFKVTDNANTILVTYTGILPDLFKEGQGVVTQGKLNNDGTFIASEVLAKHDETYMPPEVAEALDKAKKQTASSVVE